MANLLPTTYCVNANITILIENKNVYRLFIIVIIFIKLSSLLIDNCYKGNL